MSAVPYERTVTGLVVPAQKSVYGFGITVPYAGFVKKLVVVQTGGPATAFNVDLYRGRVIETPDGPPTVALDASLLRVMPQISAAAGNAAVFFSADYGYIYMNRDQETLSPGTDRKLYVALSFSTAPSLDTTWDIAIGLVAIDR